MMPGCRREPLTGPSPIRWRPAGLALLGLGFATASATAALREAEPPPPVASQRAPWASPELPLDAEGIPTRQLTDEELFRLLVALSAHSQPATALLARCHGRGLPYGHPDWRSCILRPEHDQ